MQSFKSLPAPALAAGTMFAGYAAQAQTFNDTGDILARSAEVEDIEYQMMVQRATQTAIWGMPAAGMIDFLKGFRRDLRGDYNDVAYLTAPTDSKHSMLTGNDVTAYTQFLLRDWADLGPAENHGGVVSRSFFKAPVNYPVKSAT